jgi:methylmalonyl-CoA/ethylmalonyl-CoA epimerase
MKVKKLDHIGIAVRRLDEATQAYEAMGLHTSKVEEVSGERVRVAMLPLGETRIELLEPTTEDSVIARFLEKRGEGIHHLALEVEDIDAACEELRAAGIKLVYETPRTGEGGSRVNFIHPSSAHGVLIELREGY